MRIEVKETKKEAEIKYPCLMMSGDGSIVIFTDRNKGTQLNRTKYIDPGYFSDCWRKEAFEPFHGTITLSND